jgi:Ni/Fe-hydrogenase subunit HybB-like protein
MKISRTAPMGGKILSRPFVFLSLLVLIAVVLLVFRFIYGLGAATNLNNGYPWGLWATLDIHFTAAMGCGGYVLAVVIYVLNKGEYHTLIRPAIVGSTLAYTLANLSAFVDIGRWWNFYQIMLPWNINLNSVMFEIAICMGLYMIVLWIEFVPAVLQRAGKQELLKKFNKWLFIVISLGIVLPTMHQSGLGAVIVAAGTKISPLWQTPWVSFLFLSSAIIMGFSVVIFEGAMTVMGFGRRLELHLYRRFAKILRWALGIYLMVRFADLIYRDALGAIAETPVRMTMFILENALFALPLVILLHPRWRGNARMLGACATSLLLAGAALRFNALIIGFNPPAGYIYFPSLIEVLVSVGLLTVEVIGFMYIVKRFPILPPRNKTVCQNTAPARVEVATG